MGGAFSVTAGSAVLQPKSALPGTRGKPLNQKIRAVGEGKTYVLTVEDLQHAHSETRQAAASGNHKQGI